MSGTIEYSKSTWSQHFFKGLLHVRMISGIEQQLHFAKLHHGGQGRHEFADKGSLGTGTSDGNQYPHRFAVDPSLDPPLARRGNVIHQFLGNPMSCELQLRWRNAHFEKIVIVGGSLNEIEGSRHDCKPLLSRKWEYELYVRAILHAFFCVLYFYP